MSEITKLYENANIEKEVIKGCYDYYSKLGIDIWKENDCRGKNCDTCKKDKSIKRYPPFTAEKQIKLIKWLTLNDFIEDLSITFRPFELMWVFKIYVVTEFASEKCISRMGADMTFEKGLASLINNLWQSLTEEEKQQVKGILE